ncbi:hypothetical protein Bbelb_211940 [Branchiostoma belcheri]|nr:hypothetical protein Bbelb_211940 [Branchiostoma belcheri]
MSQAKGGVGKPAAAAAGPSTNPARVSSGRTPINTNTKHPEQWTLLNDWNMEKREQYEYWFLDVQTQITNMATKLDQSMWEHPHPESPYYGFPPRDELELQNQWLRHLMEDKMATVPNTMAYGIARKINY